MKRNPVAAWRLLETWSGPFAIIHRADGALELTWLDGTGDPELPRRARDESLDPELADALGRYFQGEPVRFESVPLPEGPAFFRRCWAACRRIAPGRTMTYGALAGAAGGGPASARAAGQAMRRNPLPIVIPCHRVIAADGGLGGFAGCSDRDAPPLRRKQELLAREATAQGVVRRVRQVS